MGEWVEGMPMELYKIAPSWSRGAWREGAVEKGQNSMNSYQLSGQGENKEDKWPFSPDQLTVSSNSGTSSTTCFIGPYTPSPGKSKKGANLDKTGVIKKNKTFNPNNL